MKALVAAVALLAVSGAARAEELVEASAKPFDDLMIEPRLGLMVPSGRLGISPAISLQGGYLWDADSDFWLVAELGYAQPRHSRSVPGADPGTGFRYRMASHDLGIFLGARKGFRAPFAKALPRLRPFAEGGLKMHVMVTTSSGDSESLGALGKNHESSLLFGLAARGGAMYQAGPGAVTLVLELGYARLNQLITGSKNLFTLQPSLGYSVRF